jgi:hypothetical protein
MKTTKVILIAAFALFMCSTVQAQSGRLSLGAELGLPMGDFGDAASTGFGGSLRYEHPMGDNIGLGLTAGYMMFGGKDEGPDWTMIPVQAFLKYYFMEQQSGFYGAAHIGIHSTTIDFGDLGDASSTDMSYAPEVGYHLASIDVGLRYQMIATEGSTTSYLGLRLAYVFGGE